MAYPTPNIWYMFEDDIQDSSGNNNHGTPYGTPTYSDSKDGYGRCKGSESGDGKYYTAPLVGITGDDKWTFAMWLHLGTFTGSEYIFEYGTDANYQRICLYRSAANQLRMLHYDFNATLSKSFPDSEWFHIAVVYDTATNVVKVYYNGVYEEQYACSNRSIVESYHYICRANWATYDMYTGKIDNYMVWADTALTEAQVAEAMNETNPVPATPVNVGGATMKNVNIS